MYSNGKAFLIDFDWAGKCRETFYIPSVGENITSYCEGRPFEPIKKEHDLELLNHYFL